MLKTEKVLLGMEGPIATVTLNRPEILNAMDGEMWQGLADAGDAINHDPEVRVVIITGAGDRAFSSGLDLKQAAKRQVATSGPRIREGYDALTSTKYSFSVFEQLSVPVIAAVNGYCLGGGIQLALACDIRIASENARFSCVFVRRGLVADCGTTFYLPRIVGIDKALELMWTGDFIDANVAERIGLVTRVVPAEDLMDVAKEFALRIARGPSVSIELQKRLTYEGLKTTSVQTQMAHEDFAQHICYQTDDAKEGAVSFFEKRDPHFTGR